MRLRQSRQHDISLKRAATVLLFYNGKTPRGGHTGRCECDYLYSKSCLSYYFSY